MAFHEMPNMWGKVWKEFFQIQPPISGDNFSNNVSIAQFSVNNEGNLNMAQPLKPSNYPEG